MKKNIRTKDVIIGEMQSFEKYRNVAPIKLKRELKGTLEKWLQEEKGKERFLRLDKLKKDSIDGKLTIEEEIEFFFELL